MAIRYGGYEVNSPDSKKRGRREREMTDRHDSRHRRQQTGEVEKVKERDRIGMGIGNGSDKDRHRRYREVNEQQKDSRKNDDREGKDLDDLQPPRQPKFREGNTNSGSLSLAKSGEVYIPPFKLARMMREIQDKSSVEYQRLTWDALRKSINGLVNKVSAANIKNIIPEIFSENLVRGRGLFCRSCMKSQMASPAFTDVFAALLAVVNSKFPEVGNLLLRRVILQFTRANERNDKPKLLAAVKFIAHLVNQQVAHEIIALELLELLLRNPTVVNVEVAVGFVTECGAILQDLSPRGLHESFECFRKILRYYGLLGQRLCKINKVYEENFEKCFVQQYSMIHRLETNRLRNVAKFFAHLLGTDALSWQVLSYIRLTEEDTTSSSRIFIKILLQELSEHLSIRLLNERLTDPAMQDSFESIFPRSNPKNTRFSINFFTSIGLGGITESLREYLKNMPHQIMQQEQAVSEFESDEEADSSNSSVSETANSDTEPDSLSSDEYAKDKRRRKRSRRD